MIRKFALIITLLFSFYVFPFSVAADPVRVGIITDLSGGMAAWGKQSILGAELARDEIIAHGGELTLFVEDHQLQAKNAVAAFNKLADTNHVDLFYVEFTPAALAIAPLSKQKKIPVIYAAAATSPLAASPYLFKTYLDYVTGCRLIAERWRADGLTKVGILKSTLEFGTLCAEGLQQIFPDAVEFSYNPGDSVATQVLLLKSKAVQAVLNATFEPDFARTLKSLQDLDWHPETGSQSDSVADAVRSQFPGMLERHTIFALPALREDFLTRVKAKDPSNQLVSIAAAGLAYLSVKQLYAARAACPKADAECVIKNLAQAPADSISGFRRWVDRVAEFNISLRTWKNGQEIVK